MWCVRMTWSSKQEGREREAEGVRVRCALERTPYLQQVGEQLQVHEEEHRKHGGAGRRAPLK
jgi:hypothetical protein